MTNEDLVLLSKFAFGMRKLTGNRVEVDRFVAERAYAKALLDMAEEHAGEREDMELMLLALKLRQKVGLMPADLPAATAAPAAAAVQAAAPSPVAEAVPAQKYIGRLR